METCLAVTCVPGGVRSNETGKAGRLLKGMRVFEGFLVRSKIIYIRKLLPALWFREELRLEAVSVDGLDKYRLLGYSFCSLGHLGSSNISFFATYFVATIHLLSKYLRGCTYVPGTGGLPEGQSTPCPVQLTV